MYKIITILGARPQFIKAAMLSREYLKHPAIEEIIIHTGQHYDTNMSEVFFTEMQIPKPKYSLNIHNMSNASMTGKMTDEIGNILQNENPDLVVVFGDTNSTLAGALAARLLKYKLAHVESGLRSFNLEMPEEFNRILTDRISNLLFCPTQQAIQNLIKEGFENYPAKIIRTGDIMLDASLYYQNFVPSKTIEKNYQLTENQYILATIHRAENTNNEENLAAIITGLNLLHKKMPVIFPAHPRTKNAITQATLKVDFQMIDPVGYLEMIGLTQNCKLVVTDSGGLQKEAFFFKKFCITPREETEWVELVENNVNILTGNKPDKMVEAFNQLNSASFPKQIELYGDGNTAALICNEMISYLQT